MKSNAKFYKLKRTMCRIFFSMFLALVCQVTLVRANKMDIGIFEASSPANTIQIKLRPDFQITPIQTITGILYTVRWPDPTIIISPGFISPYFVQPQGPPVLYNGFYYQVFAAVPFGPVGTTVNPGDEILISTLTYSGGACSYFEIINDSWTSTHNGSVYLELGGLDVTGIIYNPIASLGSVGGTVNGGGTINLGQSTGILTLTGYSGTILKWQKRLNSGAWSDISASSGLTSYSEIPVSDGVWDYRAAIQRGSCPIEYSVPAQVNVVIASTQWTGNTNDDWFLAGNWTNGVPSQIVNAIIPVVSPKPYPQINSDAHCKLGNIAAGAAVTILTIGKLTAHGNLINNGSLIIKSTSTGDGSFIDNGTITGTGTAKVERYLESEKWHFISPPISNGLSGIYYDIYLRLFNEPTGTYNYIVPVDVPLNPMQGYEAWADNDMTGTITVNYIGALNTGVLNKSNLTNTPGSPNRGYNLVGNPYPSAVDWDIAAGWTRTNIDNATYLWNPIFGNYSAYNNGVGTNGGTSIIPSGQGFFIHVTNGNIGSLTVNNNARLHHNKLFLKGADAITDAPFLRLITNSEFNSYSDETVIRFVDNASTFFDSEFDAYKMMGLNEAPQLYSVTPDPENLTVNTNPNLTSNMDIPVGYKVGISGIYTIEATEKLNFTAATNIVLEDKKDNIQINLNDQSVYSFYADPLDDPDRFVVHFQPNPSDVAQNLTQDIFIFSDRNEIYIKHSEAGLLKGDLIISDLLGKVIYREKISAPGIYQIAAPNSGICIVSFMNEMDHKAYRKEVFLK